MPTKPNNHVKPTPEELEAATQAAIAEAEKLKDAPPEEPQPQPEPTPEAPKEEQPVEPPKEEQLKKKLSASARENQKIYAKNRVITRALVEADEVPEPTDEELTKAYKDWDVMSDIEKELAKETLVSRKWRKIVSEAKEQATKIEKWNDSIEEFVANPQTLIDNPDLEGKTEAFREFATKEEHNSVPFNILVSAFLHQESMAKKPKRGKMFETGSGGPNSRPTPSSDKLSLEEARRLRESDYNKWKEYLKEGKIEQSF